MRRLPTVLVTAAVGLVVAGCAKKPFDGPTVDAFNGRLAQGGKTVAFAPGEDVTLQVIHHDSGKQFGVPIKPDGTFQIGWMPIGKYSAILKRAPRTGVRGG